MSAEDSEHGGDMHRLVSPAVGYVMKVYPRFSETFIVNEILAHQAAGQSLDLFSLRSPVEGRFHRALSQVQASVTYLEGVSGKASVAWRALAQANDELPGIHDHLGEVLETDVRDACQALELATLVTRRGIRHLHAHFGSLATTVARLAARLSGITYSFTAHAKDIFHESVDPADLSRKLADAHAVATVSDYNLAYLRQTYGSAACRVRRIYNGLDLDEFGYRAPVHRAPVIAAVGRLVEKKGFGDLLDACALLARRGRSFRCVVVGTGEQEQRLRMQAAELNLGDHVSFQGVLTQDEVKAIVKQAAVLAAPCVVGDDGNRDGLPTVLLEAMALGTPCVSTPVTGIPEVIVDGDTGLLVGEHDPVGLAHGLERLLANPPLRVALASRARARVEADFDIRVQTLRLRALFAAATATTAPTERDESERPLEVAV